jgi:hypothetical protein
MDICFIIPKFLLVVVYPKSETVASNGFVEKNVFAVLLKFVSRYWKSGPFLFNVELKRYFFIF